MQCFPASGVCRSGSSSQAERRAQLSAVMDTMISVESEDDPGDEPSDDSDDSVDVAGKVSDARSGGSSGIAGDKSKRKMNSAGPSLQATVAPVAVMSTLKKSISRNRSKPFSRWPAFLLQKAWSLRGITGQSKQKDSEKMAVLLENYDKTFERPSPYLADLANRAAGVREAWFSICAVTLITMQGHQTIQRQNTR